MSTSSYKTGNQELQLIRPTLAIGEGSVEEEHEDEAEPGTEECEDMSGERESREVWSRVKPKGPSNEERRKHRLTHFPFRSWCPECVAGRGRDHAHRRREPEEREFNEIFFDYAFPRKEKAGQYITILVGRDRKSKTIIAHVYL